MLFHQVLVAAILFISSSLFAQNPGEMELKAQPSLAHLHWNHQLGIGLGFFDDLQVPQSQYATYRADGTSVTADTSRHVGAAVGFGLQLQYRDFFSELTLTHMASLLGELETTSSTFLSYSLRSGYEYQIQNVSLGLSLEALRTHLNNISTGHILEAMLATVHMKVQKGKWTVATRLAKDLDSRFGYAQGGRYLQKLERTQMSMRKVAFELSHSLSLNKSISVFFEDETAEVHIPQLEVYNDLGLWLPIHDDIKSHSRTLLLSTQMLGVRLKLMM